MILPDSCADGLEENLRGLDYEDTLGVFFDLIIPPIYRPDFRNDVDAGRKAMFY